MTRSRLAHVLIGGIAVTALSGCEQVEQAATEAADKARQTAVQTLDEARQAGSVEQAAQSADKAVQELKQQAAGLLKQASDYLSGGKQSPQGDQPGAEQGQAPAADAQVDG